VGAEKEAMMTCQGDACSVVEVTWVEGAAGYSVKNISDRGVRVVLTGFNYARTVLLGPREEQVISVEEFEPPVLADFCY
jgi:hypothetical protein